MPVISTQSFARLILLALLATGCASMDNSDFREAKEMLALGRVDEGLARIEALAARNPDNAEYRAYLLRQRELRSNRLLQQAQAAMVN
ncbi:MAG TPA: hypothetical protein PLW86_02125, partial [Rhodocyclaceae bacterium]|nr:hypothetical protein [Rhodocyclaceae bacterium]